MISLSSEITDSKGRRARHGWLFFDSNCAFCTSISRWASRVLGPRGYGVAPLQDPRVQGLLALPPDQLLSEMRVLTSDGRQIGGADALVFLAREVWWAWPLYGLAQLPGVPRLLGMGYRWIAKHRQCASGVCACREASIRPELEGKHEGGNQK
jgi:predicted DCC family thiol-disulfide oxidoreductase YuxK